MKRHILAITAALFVLSACGKKELPLEQPASRPGETARPATAAQPQTAAPYAKKDTYFKLPNAAGGEIDLAAYAGKPVLVMFFTETCPYCRSAAPFIQKVYASYSPKGFGVVGILLQDSPQPALNFAADLGVAFPLAYSGKEISRNYRTQGVPYIYLLNKQHEIYDVWEGYDPRYDAAIIKAVETVLAKK
ncbi:MAG: TlpA family protein disulfide reductase [Elusimicrobiota bacterium]|nr:TlpA family protein disulfide reductase [Elusimicrobiota bacterium]